MIQRPGPVPSKSMVWSINHKEDRKMAASPKYKVYYKNEYIASTKYSVEAAAVAGMRKGSIVKFNHRHVVWQEGEEEVDAGESWDQAGEIMDNRAAKILSKQLKRPS